MSHTAQSSLYTKMMKKTLTQDLENGCDYFLLDTIGGIEYYTPNDEMDGAIVAISREHKLANNTGFFEMDDMEDPEGDYVQVVDNNEIKCKFEA